MLTANAASERGEAGQQASAAGPGGPRAQPAHGAREEPGEREHADGADLEQRAEPLVVEDLGASPPYWSVTRVPKPLPKNGAA